MKIVFVVMMAAVLVVTGCGKSSAEKLTEKLLEKSMEQDGIKGDVKISDGKISINTTDEDGKKISIKQTGENMTIESEDGVTTMSSGASVKLPDNFPKDVYVYNGASLMTAVTVPEGFSIVLQSKDSVEKVVSAYKAKMPANGWTEDSAFTTPQQTVISYKKGDKTTSLMIMGADGQTQIILSVTKEDE